MKIITSIFVFCVLSVPLFVSATNHQVTNPGPANAVPQVSNPGPIKTTLPNPIGVNNLAALLFKIVNIVVSFSYIVVAFFLILSGFKFVAAQGSEDKLNDAKNTFKYTIIGAILVIGAQVIVGVVSTIFKQIGS